jgi:hypothetical protein
VRDEGRQLAGILLQYISLLVLDIPVIQYSRLLLWWRTGTCTELFSCVLRVLHYAAHRAQFILSRRWSCLFLDLLHLYQCLMIIKTCAPFRHSTYIIHGYICMVPAITSFYWKWTYLGGVSSPVWVDNPRPRHQRKSRSRFRHGDRQFVRERMLGTVSYYYR